MDNGYACGALRTEFCRATGATRHASTGGVVIRPSAYVADFFRLSKSRCGLPALRAPDRLAFVAVPKCQRCFGRTRRTSTDAVLFAASPCTSATATLKRGRGFPPRMRFCARRCTNISGTRDFPLSRLYTQIDWRGCTTCFTIVLSNPQHAPFSMP